MTPNLQATVDENKMVNAPNTQGDFTVRQPIVTSDSNPSPLPTTTGEPTVGDTLSGISDTIGNITNILRGQPQTPIPAVTGEQTVGQSFNQPGLAGFGDPLLERQLRNEALGNIDERQIQRNQLDLFQAEIDAVNQAFDQELAQARLEGQGRLGSQRAIAARGGLLGSDFAGAQKERVQNFNTEIRRGIEAERAAKIGSILGTARENAAAEIRAKRLARQQGAQSYLSYLTNQQQVREQNLDRVAQAFIEQGIDPSALDENELAAIASESSTNVPDLLARYGRILASSQTQGDQFTLSEGERRFDSQGNLIAEGPASEAAGGKIFSTSRGLVRVNPETGEAELVFDSGGGSGSGSVSFTNSEKKKLEQAGLSQATRQEQLDFLYGDNDITAGFQTARNFIADNPSASKEELKLALLERQEQLGLTTGDINAILDEAGVPSKDQLLPLTPQATQTLASGIRKKVAEFGVSSKDELDRAIEFVKRGKIVLNGKEYQLTQQQINDLVKALEDMGPRTLTERILPGGG